MKIDAAFQGSLFANDFLCDTIVETPDWQAIDDAALDDIEAGLRASGRSPPRARRSVPPMGTSSTRPPDYLLEVGRRLQIVRIALGVSAVELCREIDAGQKAYSSWENGKRLFGVLAAVRLKKRYGVTLDWIYDGDPKGLPARLAKRVREIEGL